MKIFKSKKIMIAAVAVFVISSIGLTTAAFSSDQMNKSSKTNTPALGGLTTEELHSKNSIADETQAIVIIPNADQTTAATTGTPSAQTEISDIDDHSDTTSAAAATPALAELSVDSVKQIVSAKTPDAIITELELDKDDGKLTYEVKATLDRTEYEYKIDAYTGVILEYKTDVNDINDADDIDDAEDMDDVDQIDDEDDMDDVNKVDDVDDVDDAGEND